MIVLQITLFMLSMLAYFYSVVMLLSVALMPALIGFVLGTCLLTASVRLDAKEAARML